MLATVDRSNALVDLPTVRRRRARAAAAPAVTGVPSSSGTTADVLRVIADPRTPTYVTVFANGRRRYSYWRPIDPATGMGGCYAALPTAECDELQAAGRITLGEPVVDPNRTTYRVRAATRVPQAPARAAAPERRRMPERRRVA
ncbi:hypothetical protein [Streptomyces sp. OP7]|uniref:hypothetical protein n=1 Tax=Streptomyces sp. OP7 TaxID=3142462 RepID=UPI0032E8D0E9